MKETTRIRLLLFASWFSVLCVNNYQQVSLPDIWTFIHLETADKV